MRSNNKFNYYYTYIAIIYFSLFHIYKYRYTVLSLLFTTNIYNTNTQKYPTVKYPIYLVSTAESQVSGLSRKYLDQLHLYQQLA